MWHWAVLGAGSQGMQPEPLLAAGARGWVWPWLEGVGPWAEVWRVAGLLNRNGERRPPQVGGEEGTNYCHVLSGQDAAASAACGQIGVRPMGHALQRGVVQGAR